MENRWRHPNIGKPHKAIFGRIERAAPRVFQLLLEEEEEFDLAERYCQKISLREGLGEPQEDFIRRWFQLNAEADALRGAGLETLIVLLEEKFEGKIPRSVLEGVFDAYFRRLQFLQRCATTIQ